MGICEEAIVALVAGQKKSLGKFQSAVFYFPFAPLYPCAIFLFFSLFSKKVPNSTSSTTMCCYLTALTLVALQASALLSVIYMAAGQAVVSTRYYNDTKFSSPGVMMMPPEEERGGSSPTMAIRPYCIQQYVRGKAVNTCLVCDVEGNVRCLENGRYAWCKDGCVVVEGLGCDMVCEGDGVIRKQGEYCVR
jgi:hypothetical protein